MGKRWPWVLGMVALWGAAFVHVWAYRTYQPDDAFIFLVYAKNLVAGNGLTFNGEVVEGYSSLLWCLSVALAGVSGIELLSAAKLLGAALLLLALPAIGMSIVRRLEAVAGWRNLALPALLFSLPPLALWANGALETMLQATLVTLACWLWFTASMYDPRPARGALAGVAFGLLACTRPEGFAFLLAVPFTEGVKHLAGRRGSWKAAFACIGVAAAFLFALLAWRRFQYGGWLPVTVSAKTGDLAAQVAVGAAYLRSFVFDFAVLVAAYAVATFVLFARRGIGGTFAAFVLLFVIGQGAFCVLAGADWMPGYRFMVPLLPLAAVVIVLAAMPRPRVLAAVVLALAAASLAAGVPLHRLAMVHARDGTGGAMIGRYIASLGLPPGSTIAVVDAGAIPFYAGVRTIDMVGLNNAHIARLPGGFMRKWDNGHVLGHRPAVVQLHTWPQSGQWWPLDDFEGTVRLFYSDEFQRWYDWDPASPIAHLFRRRSEPRPGSYMEGFFRAQVEARYDAQSGRIAATVRKSGPGAWPVAPTPRLQGGTVVLRARWVGEDGAIAGEHHMALPQPLREGESTALALTLPPVPGKRLQVCLVLYGITDFPGCGTASP